MATPRALVVCARDAMADRPKPAPRRTAEITPPSEISRYLPWFALAGAVIALVVTVVKSPAYNLYAATVLLVGAALGLGYVAWQHEMTLEPGERLRLGVRAVTALAVLAALGPLAITLYPPPPAGVISLDRTGASGSVTVGGAAATIVLEAQGTFKRDIGDEARARYVLNVARERAEETVEGYFQRTGAAGPTAGPGGSGASSDATGSRHVLRSLRGPGRYTLSLERMPDVLEPPMRVAVRAEPIPQWALGVLFGALALAALVVDARLARRGVESAFAPSLFVMLAAVFYLHASYTRDTLPGDLLAATLVGVLGGGLGGEVLSRVARAILK